MIELKNITKEYGTGDVKKIALDDVTIQIKDGEFLAVMGASGSGKSTFLNICGCMDKATSGQYLLDGKDVSKLKEKEMCRIRGKKISFVFQNFALMEKYTAYENIEMPLVNQKIKRSERKKKITEIAQKLKIEDQLHKLPKDMSGGQQQRVALARTLVCDADIILADEPTGALDHNTGMELMDLLKDLNQKDKKTIIVVTHDENVAEYADKVISISDGKIRMA